MNTATANRPRKEGGVSWDEPTIAEHDKERGTRQKISEPKTPFRPDRTRGGAGAAQSPSSAVSEDSGHQSGDDMIDEGALHAALAQGWGDSEADGDDDAMVVVGEGAWEDGVPRQRRPGEGGEGASSAAASAASSGAQAPPHPSGTPGDDSLMSGAPGSRQRASSAGSRSEDGSRRTPLQHTHSHAGMHAHFSRGPGGESGSPAAASHQPADGSGGGVGGAGLPPPYSLPPPSGADSSSAAHPAPPALHSGTPSASGISSSSAAALSPTTPGSSSSGGPSPGGSLVVGGDSGGGAAPFPWDEHDRESGASERSGFAAKRKHHYVGEFALARARAAALQAAEDEEEEGARGSGRAAPAGEGAGDAEMQ